MAKFLDCVECGNTFNADASFCPQCKSPPPDRVVDPRDQPPSELPTDSSERDAVSSFASVAVSDRWKQRFAVIEEISVLSGDLYGRFRPQRGQFYKAMFNVLALLFGPFYYFAKGMVRRALLGSAMVFLAAVVLIALEENLGFSPSGVALAVPWALYANRDYYATKVLGQTMWPAFKWADSVVVSGTAAVLSLGVLFWAASLTLPSDADLIAGSIEDSLRSTTSEWSVHCPDEAAFEPFLEFDCTGSVIIASTDREFTDIPIHVTILSPDDLAFEVELPRSSDSSAAPPYSEYSEAGI